MLFHLVIKWLKNLEVYPNVLNYLEVYPNVLSYLEFLIYSLESKKVKIQCTGRMSQRHLCLYFIAQRGTRGKVANFQIFNDVSALFDRSQNYLFLIFGEI